MKLTVLGADDLRQALPMGEAVEAMKRAFADFSSGRADVPQRLSVPVATSRCRTPTTCSTTETSTSRSARRSSTPV